MKPSNKPSKTKHTPKFAPAANGIITCIKGHRCDVVDLNVERVTMLCPTCGISVSIREGLKATNARGNSSVTK
jgi:hypothetical protein